MLIVWLAMIYFATLGICVGIAEINPEYEEGMRIVFAPVFFLRWLLNG